MDVFDLMFMLYFTRKKVVTPLNYCQKIDFIDIIEHRETGRIIKISYFARDVLSKHYSDRDRSIKE